MFAGAPLQTLGIGVGEYIPLLANGVLYENGLGVFLSAFDVLH